MNSAGSGLLSNPIQYSKTSEVLKTSEVCSEAYESKKENHITPIIVQQTLHFLPSYLQAGGKRCCRQMSPLLSF
jgi:hypothetical protein